MDETDENISADDASMVEGPSSVKVKLKKRSLVERELETSLTARVTSPVTNGDTCSTSRYGRARRLKTDPESIDPEKVLKQMKSPTQDVTPVKMQSPVYKMHASNSPIKQEPKETPKKLIETDSSLQNQIENIYHENISLSRFGSDEKKKSPGSKFPKVYVGKDLIQKREKEDTVVLIKNMFSPVQSPYKSTNSHLNNILERSSEKYHLNTASKSHNGYGNTSVVKTLDFDSSKKKKKENRDNKVVLSKSDLFDMEAKCEYQVGDLAWARMGTYPFWPCIVTREPSSGMFVKKKLFGRIERDIVHVTFFGDNGRRGWIVDTMLRRFLGQLEFEATRERFSPTAKKRDPRLYAAYFISEKKMPQWTISVEEAEMLLREPKRLRIDLLNDMLMKSRVTKATSKSHKSGKITRTASDVSLSESLYDTLFSEDDGKAEDPERSRSKTRKSLDVSEVVTACLDNMAAKTGITKIQRQSHMDRWLQKAKSKTPEKLQNKLTPQKKEKEVKVISSKKKKVSPIVPKLKPYSFRKSVNESRNLKSHHNEHDYSTKANNNDTAEIYIEALAGGCGIGVIAKVESLSEKEDSKDDSEVQTIGEVIAVEEALTSTTDKDIVIQDNVEIAPIVSDDNTVDEIQVNLSVEEDVQIENCLEPEQILESNVADEQKPIEGTTEEPSKEVENVMVGSAKAIEAMEVDGDEYVSLTSPSFEELVNENTTVTSGQEICGQLDSDNKNNNENVQYSANAKDEETNLENYVESMEVDVADVSVSATKSKVDIETDIQQTNITESDKPLESDLDTISLQANLHKPENSSEVKLDDHSTKHNNDKSFLRKRLRWSKEIKQDTVLNDNETQNDLNKPILPRKRSLRRAPIHLNDYEVSIKNSQRGSNAQKELLLNSKEDSRISHESKTEIEQANIELKHKKDDVIMDHHNKLNSLEKQVTDKKKSSVNSDAGKIEDESIRKDQINSDEQELSLQSTQEDSKVCLSLEIISHKETYQIDLNKQDIALVECDSKKDVDQPILTRNRSLRRHSKKNNDDSKAFDEGQKISKEVILQNAQENSNKECLSLECESPMEKSMIKLQETEKHDNILDQKDLSKPILTRKRSLRGRAEKKKDDDVINKSQKITNDDDLLLQSSQENMSILNKSLECESQMEKEQIETQEPKMLDNILDDNKPQQDLDQPILTRKRSSRRSEKRKDDDTIIKSQIKPNDDDLLLQSSQENISILNESVECESQIKKAPIESQEPKMQDNILDDYKTQQDLDQPVLTRKRSSRRSEKRKDDDTFIKNQIKTNDDDLLLQSSQENISILNESVECESQINKKAPIEAQEPKMQDNILNDYKTQQDLDQPGLTRKRSSRRSEKRKNDETVIKSEIKTIDDDLLLQSSQENISILNETLECQSQIEKTQIETQEPKMQDNILDEHKTQPDLDQLILTRKRSSRRSETRKADGTIIKTNADDLLLQSAQANESNECESKIAKAQIELQEPKKQDAILDDCKTQKDSSQPIVTRKRSLRRSEKKDEDKAIKKSQIITNEDELSLQSAQENSNVENVPHEFENQMAQNELHTLNKQDSDIDDCNNQKNLDQPIRKERLRRYSQVTSQDEVFDPFNENQTDISKQEKIFTPVEASKESTSHLTDSDLIKSQIEEDTGLLSTIPTEKQMESESLDVKNTDGNVQISSEIHTEIKPASTSVNAIEITQPELEIREKDHIDPHKEEAKITGDSDDRLELHSQKNCVLPELEEDMEYGHLDFTEKVTIQERIKKEVISSQITVNDNSHMDVDTEENEYDHLDFIFSSLSKQKQDVDIKSSSDVLFNYSDSATNGLNSKEKVTENAQILIDPEKNNEILKEKSLLYPVSINNSKQRELRVSVEKLPLNILPPCIINNCQDKLVQDNFVSNENKVSIGIDEDMLLNSEEKAETVAEEISNGHCNNVSDISADEELVERLILQDDSFEELNAENDDNDRTNDTKNDVFSNDTSLQVVNDSISTDSTVSQDIKNVSGSLNGDQSKEKSEVENRSSTASMTYRKSIETTSTAAIHTDNNTVNEPEAFSHNSTTSVKTPDVINKTTENIVPSINIDEFVTSVNRLPEPVKLNGFHIDECLDFSDGEFNAETSSINSEDSEPLSVTKSKLISKNRTKALKALDDPEFVKYLELRQDQLMDEHPELSQDEIVEYLYKTWQYEENAKPDLVKNDDFEQSGLVKGLNQNLKPKKSRNNFRDSKKRSKKRDEDSVSINSDISDTSVKRRLRTRMNKSPATSIDIEDNEIGLTKEMTLEIKTELLDNVSVNTDISSNSAKSPVDKSTDTHTTESKSVSPTNSYHASNKNASPDVEKYVKHSKVKDKTKSPKTKETTIKSYFKSTALSAVSEANHTDVEIQIDTLKKIKEEYDPDTASINSEDSEVFQTKRRRKYDKTNKSMTDPEFLKYVELRQDPLIDENPQLSHDEIVAYLYKTWLYEESLKPDLKKTDDLEQASLVKGLEQAPSTPQHKRVKKKIKVEKDYWADEDVLPKDKPKRKISQPYYNEDLSDIEDEIQMFEIFKPKKKLNMASDTQVKTEDEKATVEEEVIEIDEVDEVELYFSQLTEPKPNVFKGLVREKVCEICERTGNLVKCKGCNSMFHVDCAQKKKEVVEIPETPSRGRKKKKKNVGRKPKNLEDSESHSDEKSQDVSEEINASMEDDFESRTVNAEDFEAVLASKMQELLPTVDANYDSYSSDDGLDWNSAPPGKCEIIDVKLKPKTVTDHSNFKCINCQENSVPVCFVCKQAVSKTGVELRQRCQTAHCYNYYHLECLDHWPQTQFHAGEPSKSNKKINEHFESLMCPRHVCHTCVSDDPRGCKTRFSGDKLARCVRCPATYHSFTKCLPAGTQILTGSLIVCPRHYEHRPGKVPCHVNTGWCFICALGGSLICCEYCPTSFHAECLNIKPPEGGYMCEDCETGRLPLYGEMVWVKLGHYRWWPGMVLHPSEIPENIMAVKHSPGEFVVRFFGQYDHYWVNRGRVFPFQEGDSGRISSQKSKIDAAFTTAMEHAQRACEILKSAAPNEEESLDIASSLLPPHYVKLKVNKPCGSLCGRRVDVEESSLTQCECPPSEEDPCGPYSQCINRMLLTECGPSCRAGDRCNNRAFERRQYPRMAPYRTPSRGWGLKTHEDIRAGQFVIEYVGELIDEEEFRRRMNRKHEIRDENFYFLTLDKERMIDAGPKGNLARFMNHCCEPNCETQKWTVLGDVRVGLFALYDIPANSELTFNYNLECAGIEKKRCMCGAKRCSGYIGAKPKQEESQPKKNKLSGKRPYKKRKNVEESPSTSKNKPKRPVGRPAKPRELTEIEKDLLIIKNATNGLSSDSEGSGRLSSLDSEMPKALKRKRVSFSTEDCISKKARVDEKSREVGD